MKRGMEPFLVLNRTISSKSVGVSQQPLYVEKHDLEEHLL